MKKKKNAVLGTAAKALGKAQELYTNCEIFIIINSNKMFYSAEHIPERGISRRSRAEAKWLSSQVSLLSLLSAVPSVPTVLQ